MADPHRDLEPEIDGPLLSTREQWKRRSLDELASIPLSAAMPEPDPHKLNASLTVLVEHALRAGASQLHLAGDTAPAGRFEDVVRPFAGLDQCDGRTVTSMLESTLDPSRAAVLTRTGAVSRVAYVPPFGWLRVHIWHGRGGMRGIVHLPSREAPRTKRLRSVMVRTLMRFHR